MKKQNEFYIGWKEEMSEGNASFLKKILIPLFVLIPILVFAVVLFQKPFNQHQFEFGKITPITGTYYGKPVPMLVADQGVLPDGISTDIVLVGYGKFGAKGIMQALEKTNGNLNGKKISLAGTLIYGDGKTLLELTEEEGSLIEIKKTPTTINPEKTASKSISLSGEIIDPKCYFGVMKPGEGKIHKSCAIRCISGGIPPVLRVKTDKPSEAQKYYLLLDEQGRDINKAVLPFVAEHINITGKSNRFFNWDVLYLNIDDLKPNLK